MTYVHCKRCGTTLQASAHARVESCPRCLAEGEYPLPAMAQGGPPEGMHPELDVVRRASRLLELGQREQMLALFAEDFAGRTLSTGELIKGRLGADAFMARANEDQNTLQADASRFEPNGRGQVGVFGRLRVRGRPASSTRRRPGSIPSRTAASSTPSPSRASPALSTCCIPARKAKGPPSRCPGSRASAGQLRGDAAAATNSRCPRRRSPYDAILPYAQAPWCRRGTYPWAPAPLGGNCTQRCNRLSTPR